VELDADVLIGRSFTLSSSLCLPDGAGGEGSIGGGPGGGDPLPIFHVRAAELGGLEAVTYTSDGGLPLVEVTPMRRAGLGWSLSDAATCASLRYEFEESYVTERYRARALHVVFVKGAQPADLMATVAISAGAEVLVSTAELDELAPTLEPLDLEGRYSVDLVRHIGFTKHFVFSEPMPGATELVIEDAKGATVEVEPRLQQGYLVGFEVEDVLSNDFKIAGELKDLAGNPLAVPVPYPGLQLAAVAGDFEQEASFIDQRHWDADGSTPCSTGTLASLEELGLSALAGSHSFATGSEYGSCPSWLRLEAAPGATEIVFDARLVGSAPEAELGTVRVCTSSLGVAGDGVCSSVEGGWTVDTDYVAPKPVVSKMRTLTFPLAPGSTDVLIELDAGEYQRLWIDSLRAQ
jgi:hypothetical protein